MACNTYVGGSGQAIDKPSQVQIWSKRGQSFGPVGYTKYLIIFIIHYLLCVFGIYILNILRKLVLFTETFRNSPINLVIGIDLSNL